ncbi:MAG: LptF/LptG family permease [Planctomycetales bacterium]|nr:LptF/LptG family permease [Planctomycetales bacterium]
MELVFGRIPGYVFRAFLAAFAITLVSVLSLFVLVDLFTKLGDFVKPERGGLLAYIATYYLWHLPVIFAQVGPVVTLVGVAFALSRLRRAGELLPVTASGMSLTRALGPVLLFSGGLAAGGIALEEWGIPAAGARIRSGGLTARGDRFQFDALVYDRARRVLFFAGKYTPAEQSAENVHLIEFDEAGGERGRTFAWTAHALPGGGWRLGGGGYRHRYDAEGRRLGTGAPDRFESLDYIGTDLLPYDVEAGGQEGRFRSLSRAGPSRDQRQSHC